MHTNNNNVSILISNKHEYVSVHSTSCPLNYVCAYSTPSFCKFNVIVTCDYVDTVTTMRLPLIIPLFCLTTLYWINSANGSPSDRQYTSATLTLDWLYQWKSNLLLINFITESPIYSWLTLSLKVQSSLD